MIDELWEHTERKGHKTTYSRKKARAKYLKAAKQRKPRKGTLRQAIGEQLGFVEQNLATLDKLLHQTGMDKLSSKQLERLEVIREVCRQQRLVLENRTHACEDRIVNCGKPHVRPIVLGKARCPVEFGQKLAFSVLEGFYLYCCTKLDSFNEGITRWTVAEKYKQIHGVYPEAILADTAYRNRKNREFCKKNHIRLSARGWGAQRNGTGHRPESGLP